jgi:hypothetical protein
MAADLFVVPTVTFRLLFVLVILAHARRRWSTRRSPRIQRVRDASAFRAGLVPDQKKSGLRF